jgi:hypothetical protein
MKRASVYKVSLVTFVLLLSSVVPAAAQQESKVIRVRFAKGATSRTYKGSVSHSTNTYVVKARKGQVMTVAVSSSDGEALFSISQQPAPDTDPVEIAADRKQWTSRLTNSGDYDISVGASRSVATYTLTITVK